jgi:ribosomal-protein-alanine N-acetyltransferase
VSGETPTTPADWRQGLPTLTGERLVLRELRKSDAPSLFEELTKPEVKPFMWSPPPTVAAFEQFIEWTFSERDTGKYICYGLVPAGEEHAVGAFELRQMQPAFLRCELGYVIAPRLWGLGIFPEAAHILFNFAFRVVKVHRIEARVAVDNPKGNAALRKIGMRREGRLRDAFWREDRYVDQFLWSTLDTDEEWRRLG